MMRNDVESKANVSISNVLNTSSDPKMQAMAYIAKGDLYWQLANLPPVPGATTQPSLQSPVSNEDLLKKSAAAYNEVLNGESFKDLAEAKASAHFGLAAIAENQATGLQLEKILKQLRRLCGERGAYGCSLHTAWHVARSANAHLSFARHSTRCVTEHRRHLESDGLHHDTASTQPVH